MNKTKKFFFSLRRLYLFIIITITFLIFFSWSSNQYFIEKQLGDSRIINLSGRQRMLSQKIVKIILHLNSNLVKNQDIYLQRLKDSLSIWNKVHYALQNGNKTLNIESNLSLVTKEFYKIINIYHQKINLLINNFITNLEKNSTRNSHIIHPLLELEKKFLAYMDKITFQFDFELIEKINDMKTIQLIMIIVTIAFIILQGFIIFKKTFKNLNCAIDKLNISEDKLKTLNATKDKLFSIISHDLRGPLGTLANHLDLFKPKLQELAKNELEDFINELGKFIKHIYDLFENLLNWAGHQSGALAFDAKNHYILIVIYEVVSMMSEIAKKKNIKIENQVQEEKQSAYIDYQMISTVLRNLISNAIKFTAENGIITVKMTKENENFIKLTVSDTGIGIPEDKIDSIFNIEQHTSTLGTNREKGTGLGLIICKEFVEKNGGEIWAESISGKGSDFHFTLPIKKL